MALQRSTLLLAGLLAALVLFIGGSAAQTPSPAPAATPVTTVQTDGTGGAANPGQLPHELSPWSMFLAADRIVKGVMLSLVLASVATWTVLIGKTIELGLAKRRLGRALRRMEGALSFKEADLALGPKAGLLGTLMAVAKREIEVSGHHAAGIKERCDSRFGELVRLDTNNMRRGMGLLATVGAISPFVGLFGTVWGIMNAFIGISKAQTTNLAVVAPGIAEALLATAIGLVAAVPAVIIYNHFSQATRRYHFLASRAAGAAQRLLSRELERRAGAAVAAAG